jgi:hypothetical protein
MPAPTALKTTPKPIEIANDITLAATPTSSRDGLSTYPMRPARTSKPVAIMPAQKPMLNAFVFIAAIKPQATVKAKDNKSPTHAKVATLGDEKYTDDECNNRLQYSKYCSP